MTFFRDCSRDFGDSGLKFGLTNFEFKLDLLKTSDVFSSPAKSLSYDMSTSLQGQQMSKLRNAVNVSKSF